MTSLSVPPMLHAKAPPCLLLAGATLEHANEEGADTVSAAAAGDQMEADQQGPNTSMAYRDATQV